MSDRWYDYIRQGIDRAGGPPPFALQQSDFLQPVAHCLGRGTPPGGRSFPSLLAHFGSRATAVDNDDRIVGLGREMAEYFRSPVVVAKGGAQDLSARDGWLDVAHCLGVVEPFDAPVTRRLIAEPARAALRSSWRRRPSIRGSRRRFTDERRHTRRQFVRLVHGAGLRVSESLVYGSLPSLTATQMDRLLPKGINRPFQYLFTYGRGVCVMGRAPTR